MSIQVEFTPRNTIRIECGDEVIEVLLPHDPSPVASAPALDPDRGRGNPIGVTPFPPGPKQAPGVMAIIAEKKNQPLDFDWTQFDPSVHLHSLDSIVGMSEDELTRLTQAGPQLDIDNGLKVVNVGVTPWSGTTPGQLESLRSIVVSPTSGVDAVRLFQLPDSV